MAIIVEAPAPAVRLSVALERQLRIVFFGTPLFAVPSLRRLVHDGWPIAAVVSAPDTPQGRRMTMTPSAVSIAAAELHVPLLKPVTLKDDAFFTAFDALRPDICVVVAYGKLIPKRYLDIPRLGYVNVHPSMLPAYRGPSPIQSAILDGCASTGVSIMVLDEAMDHGPVLAQQAWTIPTGFDASLCEDELSRLGAEVLSQTLPLYAKGTLQPQPQNESLATVCRKFSRVDGRINWSQSAVQIHNLIRALAANPGVWCTWQDRVLSISGSYVFDAPIPDRQQPGTVVLHAGHCIVACGDGAIVLQTVQLEGSTRQSVRDFLNGHPQFIGAHLS